MARYGASRTTPLIPWLTRKDPTVTAVEKAPTILTRTGAVKLRDRIRRNLQTVDADLLRAWEGRAWEALGLESWAEFCDTITADLEFVRLRVPQRRERALVLLEGGASERDVAAACGVSPATAHTDVVHLVESGRLQRPELVRSADGALRPSTITRPEPAPTTSVDRCGLTLLMHEAWQRVELGGDDGITCPELERATRWRHGRASSLLHRLERAGFVKRDGRTREKFGTRHSVYVALPLG